MQNVVRRNIVHWVSVQMQFHIMLIIASITNTSISLSLYLYLYLSISIFIYQYHHHHHNRRRHHNRHYYLYRRCHHHNHYYYRVLQLSTMYCFLGVVVFIVKDVFSIFSNVFSLTVYIADFLTITYKSTNVSHVPIIINTLNLITVP